MTSRVIPVDPFDYVVFGGTGDLARRKLLPSLYHRFHDGQVPDGSRIIGASRRDLSERKYRDFARESIEKFVAKEDRTAAKITKFLSMLSYVALDATGESGWKELARHLGDSERIRAFYLAVGPDLFDDICRQIGAHKLVTQNSRVVIEKPIGKSLESARAVNKAVGAVFSEDQIFRIDHYLGKESVQNLMALRFANALYEPLWNSAHIDHVQITVAIPPARCVTWCRTISSSCFVWWRWNRRKAWMPIRFAMKS